MIHYRTCNLCDAGCGVAITHDGKQVTAIRGDKYDSFSRGHICPKGVALKDLHEDPDRLRQPMKKVDGQFEPIGWEQAIDEVTGALIDIQRRYCNDSVGVYVGNPVAHSYEAILGLGPFLDVLDTKNRFSATSVDQLPHFVAGYELYGNALMMPVPDLDHTELLVIMGANPVVSNGSLMTAGDPVGRLKGIQKRGGRIIVIDPRRTQTARMADQHLFIRPGTDGLLLMAVLHVIFSENLEDLGHLQAHTRGLPVLKTLAAEFSPAEVSETVGIGVEQIVELARDFCNTPRAAWYGRIGACAQRFGGLNVWLVNLINIVTANLDRIGGMMFSQPAIDIVTGAKLTGFNGSHGSYRSRVSRAPEFGKEFPASVFAEEMETPGPGQIRALLTVAGNPALSLPNGRRLESAFQNLELMVSLDMYVNETTCHADYILPPLSPLERSHYTLGFDIVSVRNRVKYSEPLFSRPDGANSEFETLMSLADGLLRHRGGAASLLRRSVFAGLKAIGADGIVAAGLRTGPYRKQFGFFGSGLDFEEVRRAEHGIDLGPLTPALPQRLYTVEKQIDLVPQFYFADVPRLRRSADEHRDTEQLVLINRRQLRSNNSWLHNSERLIRGRYRCTLLIHPADAQTRDIDDGQQVRVLTRVGSVETVCEYDDGLLPGVVSLPHGWGHDRATTKLRVAAGVPGVSVNDITDDTQIDELTGTSVLFGAAVEVAAVT